MIAHQTWPTGKTDREPLESGYQSGTDSDTSSDSGNEEIDTSDLHGLNDAEASTLAYWQYRQSKRRWRRLTLKPTRASSEDGDASSEKGKEKASPGKDKGKPTAKERQFS